MSNLATLPGGSEALPEENVAAPASLHKYQYAEFAGWNGERYLKKLLRQILPMALYRTWEIFADHQAPGNDCYLGVTHLAEIAGRATRTMEKNLASLNAKRLLFERAERKFFHKEDGHLLSRVVMIKDFAGLYALAHEYHQWLESEEYIAPDRELIALVEQEPRLVAKVRRFDNYRRLLYNRLPGPPPLAREEDRWFTDYQSEQAPFEETIQTKRALVQKSALIPAKDPQTYLSENVPNGPVKRKGESPISYRIKKISDDSASSSSQNYAQSGTQEALTEDITLCIASSQPEQAKEQAPGKETPLISGKGDEQLSPGQRLAASFLSEITLPFGDRSPKGTRTRVLSLLSEAHLEQPAEIVICLFRAYAVARDTSAIRPAYCHPTTGQTNRMPLFCAMVQRFADECQQGILSSYFWQQIAKDIAVDACLAKWWDTHRTLIDVFVEAISDNSTEMREQPDSTLGRETSDQAPQAQRGSSRLKRSIWLSQTDEQREERAKYAHRVLRSLSEMAVPIPGAVVLWEHLACGCPVYYQRKGREICALCFPDPTWPEDALKLIRSIVERDTIAGLVQDAIRDITPCASEGTAIVTEELQSCNEATGWIERDEAYACATHLLDEMACNGYVVEVYLHLAGEQYQVIVRGADGELACETAEQIDYLIEQARNRCL